MPANKTIQLSYGDSYDEVRHLLDSYDWRIRDAEALMKCNDCHHQSREYAEHDDVREPEMDGEEPCQVRCPKCKSWYYWEQDAGSE